jgi:hypothetical protein
MFNSNVSNSGLSSASLQPHIDGMTADDAQRPQGPKTKQQDSRFSGLAARPSVSGPAPEHTVRAKVAVTSSTGTLVRSPSIKVPPFPMDDAGRIDLPATKVLTALCKANDVCYVGDTHGKNAIPALIGQSARNMKAAGVGVAFVEFVKSAQNQEFQTALGKGPAAVKDLIKQDWGNHSDKWLTGVAKALCDMRQAGIEIIGMDRKVSMPPPENLLQGIRYMNARLACNPHWNQVISDHRKTHAGAKCLVWGGEAHFRNSQAAGSPANLPAGPVLNFKLVNPDVSEVGVSRLNTADNHATVLTTLAENQP